MRSDKFVQACLLLAVTSPIAASASLGGRASEETLAKTQISTLAQEFHDLRAAGVLKTNGDGKIVVTDEFLSKLQALGISSEVYSTATIYCPEREN